MKDKIEAKNKCSSGWAKISAIDNITEETKKQHIFIHQAKIIRVCKLLRSTVFVMYSGTIKISR